MINTSINDSSLSYIHNQLDDILHWLNLSYSLGIAEPKFDIHLDSIGIKFWADRYYYTLILPIRRHDGQRWTSEDDKSVRVLNSAMHTYHLFESEINGVSFQFYAYIKYDVNTRLNIVSKDTYKCNRQVELCTFCQITLCTFIIQK
ncbi:hypothetical protein [Alkalibacterium sp. MB6]|uniref:hypothetical protein n=1 Tax=Alkalibacterium sp. MB6 TaxID=2081965 RepID=UPI00137AC023|nr:hypothetical protein [Alkalibacterium sp. MB6]